MHSGENKRSGQKSADTEAVAEFVLHYAQDNGMKYEETSAKIVEGVVS